ncbi:hypothetical protein M514_21691, partial [Trichuris suis]
RRKQGPPSNRGWTVECAQDENSKDNNRQIRQALTHAYFSEAMYMLDEQIALNSGSAVSTKMSISLVMLRMFVPFMRAKHSSTALLQKTKRPDPSDNLL